MPNYSREVRNGKPSRLTTGLLDNSISFAKRTLLGLGMLGLIAGCRITPEGRNFINNMGYTAAGTFVQESITREVWGNGQEVANIQGGVQRPHSDRKVIFSGGEFTYWENGSAYKTKEERGTIFRMGDNGWTPVPNGIRIFYMNN
ncbi:MAG: hypothetical protein ABIH25_04495 [Candidatus Woesearchaeota archaeon]